MPAQQPVNLEPGIPRAARGAIALAVLCIWPGTQALGQTIRTGTGFAVSTATHIISNAHVATGCKTLRILQGSASASATLVAWDDKVDLALLQTDLRTPRIAALRSTPAVRLGEPVISFGFPLAGSLSKEGNLTTGNVSALAGLRDDPTYLQMTAPVQPGNSGGPLLDAAAHVIGVVTAKLDAVAIAKRTGDIPQNVNFAIKTEVLRPLLRANGVPFDEEVSDRTLPTADIAELARGFTVQIECVPGRSALPEPSRVQATPRAAPPVSATPIEPPAAAPDAPAPVVADADREQVVQQVQLIAVRTPYPTTAPETRELTIANGSDQNVYKVTVGWLDRALQRCPYSPSAYSGRREIYVSVKSGEQGKTMGNFPANAKLFCVIDAAFLEPTRPRAEPAPQPAEPQVTPTPPAPAAPEEAAPEEAAAPVAPAAPAVPTDPDAAPETSPPAPSPPEPARPETPPSGPGRQ
jgi:hypothetical protein